MRFEIKENSLQDIMSRQREMRLVAQHFTDLALNNLTPGQTENIKCPFVGGM